ncbi:ATP-binding protein [Paenibacillus sp. 1001270B_150601_E10]|uniref:hybrid sensor histidine kinase/response regulator n=1 Tax=Paenibacillus sp. 1001270B_150601_E10 TaxID=2787079 RepID=UPI001E2CA73E|nr:ATP-binding protein [Paenibacillus sp. 1001270B_150601_E10]
MSNCKNMMTKRKLIITSLFFLCILSVIRIVWLEIHSSPDHPTAVQGKLDLRDFDLKELRSITLDGEWEFYPKQFLIGEDLENTAYLRSYIQVPGNWASSLSPTELNANGYGTYRLRIQVNPRFQDTYGMKITNIAASYEVFIDGVLHKQSGKPAAAKEDYHPKNVPYTLFFSTEQEEIELVIHAANYDHADKGGMMQSILFGTDRTISKEQRFVEDIQLAVYVIFMLHIVYALILYIIGYRHKELIYFMLMSCSGILITMVNDDQFLFSLIPLSYSWTIKISYLLYIIAANFLLQFVRCILPKYINSKVCKWITITSLVYCMFVFFAPSTSILSAEVWYLIAYLPPFAVAMYVTMRAVLNREEDSIFLVLAAAAIVNSVVWGMIEDCKLIETTYYPLDWIISIITIASYCFKRYIRASRKMSILAYQLQQADKRKDEFLVNTSNEIRTPLQGMIHIAEHVLDEEKSYLHSRNAHNLELLITIGQRLSVTLLDLLEVTRLREGGVVLHLQAISVQSVASGVIDMLNMMTDGKPISLTMDIPKSFPKVIADEKRLVQVLFNLTHNAIKFTNEGTVSIKAEIQQGQAIIFVADTGIGMDQELQNRIFSLYEQGENDIVESVGGFGLGLSTSQMLVQLHGSKLKVKSTPGHGSVFSFRLRIANETDQWQHRLMEQATEAPHHTKKAEGRGISVESESPTTPAMTPRILIVDDDPVNVKILKDILSVDPYEIVTLTTGKAALDKLDERKWDVMIIDVMMPQMSGYELTRLVRERFSISELPILLLTARYRTEDVYPGFIAGANDYVTKPVHAMELRTRVKAWTELKQSVNERLRMEAAYLQAQIQPHFLFNTLNTITALSSFDTHKMNDLIDAFSSYLRISFDFSNSDQFVPLEHELELVRSYLYIEKERFEDRLNVVWDIDQSIHIHIPPLTIQPLVENAVKHGILSRLETGTVFIRIQQHKHCVSVVIQDDGTGMDENKRKQLLDPAAHEEERGIGLLNTDRRLKQLYGKGLKIQSQHNLGTIVSFDIPIR